MRDAGEQRQEGLQEPADVLQHPLPASAHHRSGCPGKRDAVQNRVRRNHPGERCGSAYAPAGDEIWGVHSARSTFRPPQHFTRPRKRAGGVMIGLHRYGKRVKRMHLVATAPDRRGFIHETLKSTAQTESLSTTTFSTAPDSSMRSPQRLHGGKLRLHPHYEAKTMQWFRSSGIAPESTLFWITGAEPRSPGQS